jgi:hypothetical protein
MPSALMVLAMLRIGSTCRLGWSFSGNPAWLAEMLGLPTQPTALENQRPSIAASSMFSVDNMRNSEDEPLRIVINILPISTEQTIVLFSWLSHEAEAAKAKLGQIFLATGDPRKYEISKLILEYCENFVISEQYYSTWSEEKKLIIKQYFEQNLQAKWEIDDPNLMLFWEN